MSGGDQYVASNAVFYSILLLLLIVFAFVALTGGRVFQINSEVPISDQLVHDIVIERLKTCLAPLHPQFGTALIGQIDAQKLGAVTMNSCITQGQEGFAGVRITTTDAIYEHILPSARYSIVTRQAAILYVNETGRYPANMEVLLS